MKKKIIILTTTLLIFSCITTYAFAKKGSKELTFNNLNTKNFIEKTQDIDLFTIKKICSYDYCDYLDGSTTNEVLKNFTNNYLNTVKNKEDRLILKVKGIKITKLIFE